MRKLDCTLLSEMGTYLLEGEPVFVLRAQDRLAMDVLHEYLKLGQAMGAKNMGRVRAVHTRFAQWRDANPGRMKVPD